MHKFWCRIWLGLTIGIALLWPVGVMGQTARIKDLTEVIGMHENHLMGMGLVVGLKNTGDRSEATLRALRNLLQRQNFRVADNEIVPGNVALVMVTATLPSQVRRGMKLDLTVSSIGDAKSLAGGTLLSTLLKGLDNQVYAVAQGSLSTSSALTTIAMATNGAIVEREVPFALATPKGELLLRLLSPDFNNAQNIADAINSKFGKDKPICFAMDMVVVKVVIPAAWAGEENLARFIAEIIALPVTPDPLSRVVIAEKTGTIIMGAAVTLSPVAIVHNHITIRIAPDEGKTGPVTVDKLVSALTAMQVAPRDLIDILRLLKRAGALHAELVIM